MNTRISKDGDVEIEFYVVRSKQRGNVSIWTEEPPADPDFERYGPYIATAQVTKRIAPQS